MVDAVRATVAAIVDVVAVRHFAGADIVELRAVRPVGQGDERVADRGEVNAVVVVCIEPEVIDLRGGDSGG